MFALVTGASGGIGKEIVKKLADDGFTVICHYCQNEQAIKELWAIYGDKIIATKCDFSDLKQTSLWAEHIAKTYPKINVLVNNASMARQCLYTDMELEEILNIINTNLTSTMIVTQKICNNMINLRYGRIINISSVWGVYGGSCEVAYSASKGGIISFTKALSRELGLSCITANCLSLGLIDTPMNSNLSKNDLDEFAKNVSLGRIGNPEEVAEVVSFLASKQSSYVTGQIIGVDGGY
ncbi:MAG: SDR family oxidoreductase [Clostridiales bacterium]|nr:SDR family oxidoreductase [Clostridiales bacterium]